MEVGLRLGTALWRLVGSCLASYFDVSSIRVKLLTIRNCVFVLLVSSAVPRVIDHL